MKVFKRNAVIITVLLFVAVAVYLNWSYNRGQDLATGYEMGQEHVRGEENGEEAESTQEGESNNLFFRESGETQTPQPPTRESSLSTAAMNYFANARLTREQARDSATTLLQEAAAIATASQEEIDNALSAITTMATFSLQEAQLENLLMAKDFEDCVVFIRDDAVSVIVPAPPEGLSQAAVARITDAVISELGISAEQLNIIPVH